MRTRPFVETVPLRDIALNRKAIESACFDQRESAHALAVRTLAGFLCVKKAVVTATRFTNNNCGCCEKDILVGHDDNGAPCILDMPEAVRDRLPGMCVSVSHTADHACGCVVIEEDTTDA